MFASPLSNLHRTHMGASRQTNMIPEPYRLPYEKVGDLAAILNRKKPEDTYRALSEQIRILLPDFNQQTVFSRVFDVDTKALALVPGQSPQDAVQKGRQFTANPSNYPNALYVEGVIFEGDSTIFRIAKVDNSKIIELKVEGLPPEPPNTYSDFFIVRKPN